MTPDERRGDAAPAGGVHPAAGGSARATDDPDPGFDLDDLVDSDRSHPESAATLDGSGATSTREPDAVDRDAAEQAGAVPAAHPAMGDRIGAEQPDDGPKQGTIWEQMGGVTGMLDSALPVIVFVVANAIGGLGWGIGAAIATAVAIAAARIARKRPVTNAIAGVFGVAVAAFIAYRTGSAKGYFLLGIWSYLLYGGALLLSMLVRWPLIGVIWEGINGRGSAWRADRRMVRRYDYATLIWVVVFALRYLVQNYLYDTDQVGWLAVFRVAMGFPLFVVAGLATIWIVAGTTKLWVPRGGLRQGLGGLARGAPPPPPSSGGPRGGGDRPQSGEPTDTSG